MSCLTVPKVDGVKKCPVCGEDMLLVGHVDKDSGEDIGIDLVGRFHLPGGFLSGSLRKYKCPNGHEATNEEPESKSKVDSFEDAERLVGYMEIHAQSPQALILFKHLVYLEYIAGYSISDLTRERMEERQSIPLPLNEYSSIIKDARKRLDKGLVPKNWLELLNEEIQRN